MRNNYKWYGFTYKEEENKDYKIIEFKEVSGEKAYKKYKRWLDRQGLIEGSSLGEAMIVTI